MQVHLPVQAKLVEKNTKAEGDSIKWVKQMNTSADLEPQHTAHPEWQFPVPDHKLKHEGQRLGRHGMMMVVVILSADEWGQGKEGEQKHKSSISSFPKVHCFFFF